jgi:hypothetical protein
MAIIDGISKLPWKEVSSARFCVIFRNGGTISGTHFPLFVGSSVGLFIE